jgi:hypothetical protein
MNSFVWLVFLGLAGAAACAALRLAVRPPAAAHLSGVAGRARWLRGIGWGAALLPAALLWFGVLGVFALCYPGENDLFPATTQLGAFGWSLLPVLAVAAFTAVAPRKAAYAAAAGLTALGLYVIIAWNVLPYGYYEDWYGWLNGATSFTVAGLVVLLSLGSGFALTRRTIVADARARRAGLTARVQRLTETRAEAVDSAAAELRRLERCQGARPRLPGHHPHRHPARRAPPGPRRVRGLLRRRRGPEQRGQARPGHYHPCPHES